MRVTAFSVPPLRNNAYLVVDEGSLEAAVIDPAQGAKKILATLKLAGATVRFILNTHGHPAPTPQVKPALLLKEGSEIRLGSTVLVVLHTPGHTEGSASFHAASEGVLFSGDTVLAGASGGTDIQGRSPAKMAASLRRLYREIPPDTR